MKSADNHTKRKALVEVFFFYRELVSHRGITMPPQGSFLAEHRALRYWLWRAHMYARNEKKKKNAQKHHLFKDLHEARLQKNMFFPSASLVQLLCHCVQRRKTRLALNHYPPVYPSVHLIFHPALSVSLSAGVTLCSPFILVENISMWSWSHLPEPDGCL